MPFDEGILIPISALQHYQFCPRQCALIHLDQIWEENTFTAEGRIMHKRAHSGKVEKRNNVRTMSSLHLRSNKYGLVGIADIVEFHRINDIWYPYPVEYKRGKSKVTDEDRIQLCAQALCLEEMLNIQVTEGALYYGQTNRRESVFFSEELLRKTLAVISKIQELFAKGQRPQAIRGKHCKNCSLAEYCMPWNSSEKVRSYLSKLFEEI